MFEEFDKNGYRIFHRAAAVYSKKTIKEAMDCFGEELEDAHENKANLVT